MEKCAINQKPQKCHHRSILIKTQFVFVELGFGEGA